MIKTPQWITLKTIAEKLGVRSEGDKVSYYQCLESWTREYKEVLYIRIIGWYYLSEFCSSAVRSIEHPTQGGIKFGLVKESSCC